MKWKRINRHDLLTPTEKLIVKSVQKIEKMGADVRLTEAQNHLHKALELLGSYVNDELKTVDLS